VMLVETAPAGVGTVHTVSSRAAGTWGAGPAQPGGNLAEYHGLGGGPQITVSGAETFTSDARWWGGVCGQRGDGDGEGEGV